MSTTVPITDRAVGQQTLQWLPLPLTPGLGPTRVRRLIEHFGGVAGVFRVSLTELEATGLLAASAQAIGTGKSFELAQEELEKAKGAGAQIISLDDKRYPSRLKEVYDPPVSFMCEETWTCCRSPESRSPVRVIQHLTDPAWPSGWRSICQRTA